MLIKRVKPIISFLKIEWSLFLKPSVPLQPRMLCANFGSNWPNDIGEEDFSNVYNVFSLLCNYITLQRVWPFI